MKRFRTILLNFLHPLFLLFIIFSPIIAEISQAFSSGTMTTGGDYNYAPYEYIDRYGNPAGYNVDLTRAVAEVTGLDVDIRLGPWGETREALETGQIDAIHGLFYSAERAKQVDFSVPHTIIYHSAFARLGTPDFSSAADLKEKALIVMRGDMTLENVEQVMRNKTAP